MKLSASIGNRTLSASIGNRTMTVELLDISEVSNNTYIIGTAYGTSSTSAAIVYRLQASGTAAGVTTTSADLTATSAYDADAAAFFTAYSITDTTEKDALNAFVLALKTGPINASNLWTDVFSGGAVYPISPTSLAAAAGNLMNPGTFDITWVNTPTHATTGVTTNGSSQYGRTGWVSSTHGTANNLSLSVYLKTNNAVTSSLIGARVSTSQTILLVPRNATNDFIFDSYNQSTGRVIVTNTDSSGLSTGTRRSAIDAEVYSGSTSLGTGATGGGTQPNIEAYLMARNDAGSPSILSGNELRIAAIGKGMTTAQVQDWFSAVNTYQTNVIAGGRNV
jgi:hypothetical protein